MRIFGKSYRYWVETIGGLLAGIIVCILLFIIDPHLSNWKDFIKEIPSIGMCTFGFLLTLLSIILQGNSSTIEWMKSRKTLFDRFIQYNKHIVILSFIISIYAYTLRFFNFQWLIHELSLESNPIIIPHIRRLLISVFGGLITWFMIDTFQFIGIFYLLIKKAK